MVGEISEDVVLICNEMYLQNVEEYCRGSMVGANEDDELYKGLVPCMFVGMKEIPMSSKRHQTLS